MHAGSHALADRRGPGKWRVSTQSLSKWPAKHARRDRRYAATLRTAGTAGRGTARNMCAPAGHEFASISRPLPLPATSHVAPAFGSCRVGTSWLDIFFKKKLRDLNFIFCRVWRKLQYKILQCFASRKLNFSVPKLFVAAVEGGVAAAMRARPANPTRFI